MRGQQCFVQATWHIRWQEVRAPTATPARPSVNDRPLGSTGDVTCHNGRDQTGTRLAFIRQVFDLAARIARPAHSGGVHSPTAERSGTMLNSGGQYREHALRIELDGACTSQQGAIFQQTRAMRRADASEERRGVISRRARRNAPSAGHHRE